MVLQQNMTFWTLDDIVIKNEILINDIVIQYVNLTNGIVIEMPSLPMLLKEHDILTNGIVINHNVLTFIL
jgi:hypothetical protein